MGQEADKSLKDRVCLGSFLHKSAAGSYAAAVEGFPKDRGIIPDHNVDTNIEDLKTGRDTVLEYTLKLIDSMN